MKGKTQDAEHRDILDWLSSLPEADDHWLDNCPEAKAIVEEGIDQARSGKVCKRTFLEYDTND